LALPKDEQFAYQQDLKTRLDYKNVLDYAKERAEEIGLEKGIEKGIEIGVEKGKLEGEQQKAIEIAKKMLAKNSNIDIIVEFTGLSYEEIKGISNNYQNF